jgi:putative hydrolase of the HAD superfamily
MIKVVCFDFFNTLAFFDPPREDVYASIAREMGVNVDRESIASALPDADNYWRKENFKSPIRQREEKDKISAYIEYGTRILKNAKTPVTPQQVLNILGKAFSIGFRFISFEDALPALKKVKAKNLKTGLISNVGQDIDSYCDELGFSPFLDFKVTSFEVGYDKPSPEIFELALKKAKAAPSETIFIGDQYEQDVVGARSVGIFPVLLDRNNSSINRDCPVIHTLHEIDKFL